MKRTIEIEIIWALAAKWERDVKEEQKLQKDGPDGDDLKFKILSSRSEGAASMKQTLAIELRALVDILA